eukprot:Pgem_evm1s20184
MWKAAIEVFQAWKNEMSDSLDSEEDDFNDDFQTCRVASLDFVNTKVERVGDGKLNIDSHEALRNFSDEDQFCPTKGVEDENLNINFNESGLGNNNQTCPESLDYVNTKVERVGDKILNTNSNMRELGEANQTFPTYLGFAERKAERVENENPKNNFNETLCELDDDNHSCLAERVRDENLDINSKETLCELDGDNQTCSKSFDFVNTNVEKVGAENLNSNERLCGLDVDNQNCSASFDFADTKIERMDDDNLGIISNKTVGESDFCVKEQNQLLISKESFWSIIMDWENAGNDLCNSTLFANGMAPLPVLYSGYEDWCSKLYPFLLDEMHKLLINNLEKELGSFTISTIGSIKKKTTRKLINSEGVLELVIKCDSPQPKDSGSLLLILNTNPNCNKMATLNDLISNV